MNGSVDSKVLSLIESKIGLYPDFPSPGILFRDIMPVMHDPFLFDSMIRALCNKVCNIKFDLVIGIESRGFLIGPIIANKMKLPFSPVRKRGKLPGDVFSVDYDLEYGQDTLQIQKSALPKGSRCLVVDDLIATGGSLKATKELVEMSGSKVAAVAVLIELYALGGRKKLGGTHVSSLFIY